jgi:predicted component of type VI protein secretion system
MKAELVPLNGDPPIPITRDLTVVGRRECCDVLIPHTSLSKRHCVLVRTDGLLMVRDLATTNGTKVNGQRVLWAALLPNDRLSLGAVKFRIYLGSDDAPSPSESAPRRAAAAGRRGAPAPVARPGPAAGGNAAGRDAAIVLDDDEEVIDLD